MKKADLMKLAADLRELMDCAAREHDTNGSGQDDSPYFSLGYIESGLRRAIGTLENGDQFSVKAPSRDEATKRWKERRRDHHRAHVIREPAIAGAETE